jgi:hypothetical protein
LSVRAQEAETTLRVEVAELVGAAGATIMRGAKENDVASQTILIDESQAGPHDVALEVFLDSRIAACIDGGGQNICTGGENFFDDVNFVYGCADMLDNDSNGVSDSADPDCNGVQGWSMSIATDPCFAIKSTTVGAPATRGATTVGTCGDLVSAPPGKRDPSGSFEKTERVDPMNPLNGGQQGAVTAVVLAFTNPVFLDQVSSSLILKLRGVSDTTGMTEGQSTAPCNVTVVDPDAEGMSGSGEPVKTAVTVAGETAIPALCHLSYTIAVRAPPPAPEFTRGDANDDGRVDIGDAVWITNEIFYSGPASVCEDAADVNDDANPPDVSDVIFLIDYQYMSGPAPLAPFPGCGSDPSADGLACATGASSCGP